MRTPVCPAPVILSLSKDDAPPVAALFDKLRVLVLRGAALFDWLRVLALPVGALFDGH